MKVWHRAATVNYHMNNDNIHIRKLWCARSTFCLLIYFFRVLFERELVCVCMYMHVARQWYVLFIAKNT